MLFVGGSALAYWTKLERDWAPLPVTNAAFWGSTAQLNQRFAAMRDYFKRSKFTVLNCTPASGLTAFDHLPFEEAIRKASAECGKQVNTKGWYS